jgi:hypothetical protein
MRATVDSDGTVTVASLVGEPSERDPQITVVNEVALAAQTVRALALAGQVLGHLGIVGTVDAGVLVRPLTMRFSLVREEFGRQEPYLGDEHLRHQRVLAGTLRDAPTDIAHNLIEALAGWGYDAFDGPWRSPDGSYRRTATDRRGLGGTEFAAALASSARGCRGHPGRLDADRDRGGDRPGPAVEDCHIRVSRIDLTRPMVTSRHLVGDEVRRMRHS